MAKKEQFLVTLYLDESEDEDVRGLELDGGDRRDIASLLMTTIERSWDISLVDSGHDHESASENAKTLWNAGCDVEVEPFR